MVFFFLRERKGNQTKNQKKHNQTKYIIRRKKEKGRETRLMCFPPFLFLLVRTTSETTGQGGEGKRCGGRKLMRVYDIL